MGIWQIYLKTLVFIFSASFGGPCRSPWVFYFSLTPYVTYFYICLLWATNNTAFGDETEQILVQKLNILCGLFMSGHVLFFVQKQYLALATTPLATHLKISSNKNVNNKTSEWWCFKIKLTMYHIYSLKTVTVNIAKWNVKINNMP